MKITQKSNVYQECVEYEVIYIRKNCHWISSRILRCISGGGGYLIFKMLEKDIRWKQKKYTDWVTT